MVSKHTPGPWNISLVAGIPGVIVGGVARKYPNGSSQDQLFMVCGCRDDNGGDAAQEANARLIAAAPDLLEALKALLDVTDFHELYGSKTEAARAAIAKATGESEQ